MIRVKQVYEPDQTDFAIRRIPATLDGLKKRVFAKTEILGIVRTHRQEWRFLPSVTPNGVLDHLLTAFPLRKLVLQGPRYQQEYPRYLWRDAHPLEVAASVPSPGAYLCHSSALFMHGLVDVIPKELFVNHEQSKKPQSSSQLQQAAVDQAFRRKQRQSAFTFSYKGHKIVALNGKQTGGLEVTELPLPTGATVRVTGLERTLIDISVRPTYAGTAKNVLEAYRKARDKVSIAKLADTLKALDYVYPYHQVIGFYLQRAGYPTKDLQPFKGQGFNLDFYLAYGMLKPEYDAEWRLYYPKGL